MLVHVAEVRTLIHSLLGMFRFLKDTTVRGELLLTVAAMLHGPAMGGQAELFSLQLPVHSGDVVVQASPVLERWQSCRFDVSSPQLRSSSGQPHTDSAPLMCWNDSGKLTAGLSFLLLLPQLLYS